MNTWKWGILGTGNIANSLAEAIQSMAEGRLLAVASRTQAKAEVFGEKWSVPRRYGSYGRLVEDADVDVVYIASPHSEHAKDMRLCLEANKHVLCEKSFTLNAQQAAACINLARERKLFLMEAMWMRFFPAMSTLREWLAEGLLGDVRLVQADFCLQLPYDPANRLYNPVLGGGALLDLGIYPLSLATMVLGLPEEVSGVAHLSHTGVDELDTITLTYGWGATAALSCSMRIYRPRVAYIVGTKGYVKIHEIFFRPDRLTLALNDRKSETITIPYAGNGYVHEVQEVHNCLDAGMLESPNMHLEETLALMGLMDELRAQWGVVYPGEMTGR